jgi:hypothetical protein
VSDLPYLVSQSAAVIHGLVHLEHLTSSRNTAFKPKKVAEGSKQWQLKQYAQQTLVSVAPAWVSDGR